MPTFYLQVDIVSTNLYKVNCTLKEEAINCFLAGQAEFVETLPDTSFLHNRMPSTPLAYVEDAEDEEYE